ncbi:MAG: protoporphyrinogen/coproporphyrinogen oxidase [Candidatus Krumholzibacteriia bacterium]
MTPTADDRTIILGGGLAGLSAGMYSGAPVYEANGEVGGVAASDTVDGFTFDRGIHILQTTSGKVLDLLAEIGVRLETHQRNAFIFSRGTYTPYPFQVNTAGLPLGLRAHCVWSFLNRSANKTSPTNYEEWMYRTLGKGFARTFLIPYSEKFWTIPPREMTFEWTGNRVPRPNVWQVLRGAVWNKQTKIGTNVDFRYPVSGVGYGTIARALADRVGEVHLGHRATSVDVDSRRVHFDNGADVPYDSLISTIPLPRLVGMSPNAPERVRAAAAKLRTNAIMVVNLGIDRPAISDRHWVHFPEKDVSFFRISYPHNFAENVTPPGMSSISAEVAYDRREPPDASALARRVKDDLIRVGAMDADAPVVTTLTRDIPYAYCIYDMHRGAAVKTIRAWLAAARIIPAGRYGLWSYFWSDEAILSGRNAAQKVYKMREAA